MFSTQLLKKMCLLLSLSLSKSSGGVAFHRPRRRSLFVVTKAVSSSSSPKKRDATPKEENDSTIIDVSALSNPSKTANTTGFDSTAFSAFERRFSGRFGAVAREYALREEEKDDVDEKTWWWEGLEIPSRYVHGVGVVPKSSMPFADALYEANARATSRFETTSSSSDFGKDGSIIRVNTARLKRKDRIRKLESKSRWAPVEVPNGTNERDTPRIESISYCEAKAAKRRGRWTRAGVLRLDRRR